MDINNILEISESVGINDQRFVGQVLSRNQRLTTSEVLTVVPFEFTMKPMNYLLYSQNRGLLNALRIKDRALAQYLNFGSTGWINYIKYQGDMTSTEIGNCQWETASENKNLVLGSLPSMLSTEYIVRAGDFCQVGLYSYMGTTTFTGITCQVILREYPTYTLMPITNDSYIAWGGEFKAMEAVYE
jgi:hypothetical protein